LSNCRRKKKASTISDRGEGGKKGVGDWGGKRGRLFFLRGGGLISDFMEKGKRIGQDSATGKGMNYRGGKGPSKQKGKRSLHYFSRGSTMKSCKHWERGETRCRKKGEAKVLSVVRREKNCAPIRDAASLAECEKKGEKATDTFPEGKGKGIRERREL